MSIQRRGDVLCIAQAMGHARWRKFIAAFGSLFDGAMNSSGYYASQIVSLPIRRTFASAC